MAITASFAGPVQTDVSHRFRMLQSMARSLRTGAFGLTSTYTPIPFDTNDFDTDGMWSGSATFTAHIDGKYMLVGSVALASPVQVNAKWQVTHKNATTDTGIISAGSVGIVNVTDFVQLVAGDTVQLAAAQYGGGSVNTAGNTVGAIVYLGE